MRPLDSILRPQFRDTKLTPYGLLPAARQPLSMYVLTYVVLFSLLFLAVSGGFSFDSPTQKTDAGLSQDARGLDTVRTQDDDLRRIIETLLFLPALIYLIYRSRRTVIVGVKDTKLFVIMALFAILSTLWSQAPLQTLRSGIYLLVNTLFAISFVGVYDPEEQMELLTLLGRFFLLLNIAFALFLPRYGVQRELSGAVTWQGICLHKNICAYATAFLAMPVFFQAKRDMFTSLSRAVYVLLSVFVILKTESRTGWIVVGVFCILLTFFWLLRRFRSTEAIVLLLVILSCSSIGAWWLYDLLPMFFVSIGKDPTLTGRTEIWAAVLTSIWKRPLLGWGYHGFWTGTQGESGYVVAQVLWNPSFAHSGYLELLLYLGSLGLVMVMWALLRGLTDGFRCLVRGCPHYVEWCISILVLTIVINIDEISLMGSLQLEWTLFITSCALLSRVAREIDNAPVRKVST